MKHTWRQVNTLTLSSSLKYTLAQHLARVTENQDARRDELAAFLKEEGYTEVSVPRKIITIEKMPLLGSGKTDYPSVQTLVE